MVIDDEVGWSFDVGIVDSLDMPLAVEGTYREDGVEVVGLPLQFHDIRHHEDVQKFDNRRDTHVMDGGDRDEAELRDLDAIPMPALRTSKAATCAEGIRPPGGGPRQLNEKV